MSAQLDRLTELAKEDPKRQFYSIAHMITFGALYAAFRGLRKKASAEWTASRTRNTNGTSRETSKLSMRGSRVVPGLHCLRV
jgi:hypothetical protein